MCGARAPGSASAAQKGPTPPGDQEDGLWSRQDEAAGCPRPRNLPSGRGRGGCGRGPGRCCPRHWPALATGISPRWARPRGIRWQQLRAQAQMPQRPPQRPWPRGRPCPKPSVGQGAQPEGKPLTGSMAATCLPPSARRLRGTEGPNERDLRSDRLCWSPWCRRGSRTPVGASPVPGPRPALFLLPGFLPSRDSAGRGGHRGQGGPFLPSLPTPSLHPPPLPLPSPPSPPPPSTLLSSPSLHPPTPVFLLHLFLLSFLLSHPFPWPPLPMCKWPEEKMHILSSKRAPTLSFGGSLCQGGGGGTGWTQASPHGPSFLSVGGDTQRPHSRRGLRGSAGPTRVSQAAVLP